MNVTFIEASAGTGKTYALVQRVVELRLDCDQDAVWMVVEPAGPACHTGAFSCFYRQVDGNRLSHDQEH